MSKATSKDMQAISDAINKELGKNDCAHYLKVAESVPVESPESTERARQLILRAFSTQFENLYRADLPHSYLSVEALRMARRGE